MIHILSHGEENLAWLVVWGYGEKYKEKLQ